MKRALQSLLLSLYALVSRSGAMRTVIGRRVFLVAYRIYKQRFESGWHHLQQFVRPDTLIIDVGANVGFFTLPFAQWVSGNSGRVLAVEPEPENVRSLIAAVASSATRDRIEVVEAAIADTTEERFLALNPANPADHRLASHGIAVRGTTLCRLVDERGRPPVSLLKIDVQGAELMVLRGASELLERDGPAIYLELDDGALTMAGTADHEVIDFLSRHGYGMNRLEADGRIVPLSTEAARQSRAELGYGDFLFLRNAAGTATVDKRADA